MSRGENIFLSATKLDCDAYRQALKAVVEAKVAGAKIHLQEHWNDAAHSVVDLCSAKLAAQDAYIGLFGFRHGWRPPGYAQSITEMEFDWACHKWPGHSPPIFLMLPAKDSAAERELVQAAEQALSKDHPDDEAERRASQQRQRDFVARAKTWAANRFIIFYDSLADLQLEGSHALKDWSASVVTSAGAGRRTARGLFSDADLGGLGRDAQFGSLERALRRLRQRPDVLAAVIAVHGPAAHGQFAFAQRLAEWDYWYDTKRWPSLDVRDPVTLGEAPGATSLARWVAERNQTPLPPGTADSVAALAERLLERLRTTDLVFVLSALGSAADRWPRFVHEFWQPLQAALLTLLAAQTAAQRPPVTHRLLLFVIDHDRAPVADASLFWDGAPEAPALDVRRGIALPELTPFDATDVETWLDRLGTQCSAPAADQARIAVEVTQPDGVPAAVFDRLQQRGLNRLV